MGWEDATSYRHDERGQVEPRTWKYVAGPITLIVTRHIHYDGWIGRCRPLFETRHLGDDLDGAKAAVVKMATEILQNALDLMPSEEPTQ